MEHAKQKAVARRRIKRRIRRKISGTGERPRLAVFRSLHYIYAQAIDDAAGRTIAAASSRDADVAAMVKGRKNLDAAKAVGSRIAEKIRAQGIEFVVFDRGGYLYHGRIKALADAAREKGLRF